jgi:cell wall-associated NlpC family hydrolase
MENTDNNQGAEQGARNNQQNNQLQARGITPFQMTPGMLPNGELDAVIPLTTHNGQSYVSLRQLTETLEFRTEWDEEASILRIGDNDIAYEVKVNSNEATREGEVIRLDEPAVMINGAAYMPADSIDALFGDAMNYEWANGELRIKPAPENLEEANDVPNFKDDPNDPFAGDDAGGDANQVSDASSIAASTTPMGEVALRNINMTAMINTAKKYIGVKYDFGAKPYPKSNRFDCSTYTQYVFRKYGVELPRLSRNQAKRGKAVSRTNLRKGDLLFFYLPGRYKSNKIVGHVGIYMGGGRMIHSSTKPKNGVQITSINKAYWKKTFLKARRVAY